MAGESEEIAMLPHEMPMALADRRIRALATVARAPRDLTEASSSLKDRATQTSIAMHLRGGARAGSTMTSVPGAGPTGCCP
jgi:hypothetical protein